MAKLSKDELTAKVSEKIEDIDLATELLEDIADSFDSDFDDTDLKSEIETLTEEVKNLKQKYKDRFMNPSDVEDDVIEDGMKEEEVIDIKELDFSKKDED